MIKGRIKIGSETIPCDLPQTTRDWSLSDFIDFKVIMNQIIDEDVNAFKGMAKAVSIVTKVDIEDILCSQLGEDYTPGKDEYEGLAAIFGYLKESALSQKGKMPKRDKFEVNYKGKTFYIPHVKAVTLSAGEVPGGISVFEAVECMEIIRLTTAKTKAEGDPLGNIWFTQYIKMLAILLHESGTEFVPDQAIRERQIAQQEVFFKDIDLETALDTDFFLLSILAPSEKTRTTVGSLNRAVFSLAAATLKPNVRLMKRLKHLAKQPLKE